MIFSGYATCLYSIKLKVASNARMPAWSEDRFAAFKKDCTLAARERSDLRYGHVRTE